VNRAPLIATGAAAAASPPSLCVGDKMYWCPRRGPRLPVPRCTRTPYQPFPFLVHRSCPAATSASPCTDHEMCGHLRHGPRVPVPCHTRSPLHPFPLLTARAIAAAPFSSPELLSLQTGGRGGVDGSGKMVESGSEHIVEARCRQELLPGAVSCGEEGH
jgi:hypothetical protein